MVIYLGMELLSQSVSIFTSVDTTKVSSQWLHQLTVQPAVQQNLLLHILTKTCCYPLKLEANQQCGGFNWIFLSHMKLSTFSCLLAIWISSLVNAWSLTILLLLVSCLFFLTVQRNVMLYCKYYLHLCGQSSLLFFQPPFLLLLTYAYCSVPCPLKV